MEAHISALALQRSKHYLEEKGFHLWIVEHWNQWSGTRQDLFGFADLIAIRHDLKGVWAINACGEDVSAHEKKYLDGYDHPKKGRQPPNPHLAVWLSGGNRFSIFGWGQRSYRNEDNSFKLTQAGERLKRKEWVLQIHEAYLEGAEVRFKEVPGE